MKSDRNVALLGDFNCVRSTSDRAGAHVSIDKSAKLLEEVTCVACLVNVGKLKIREGALKYSRFQGASHARLDRIYVSVLLSSAVSRYYEKPVCFSDHCIVVCDIGDSAKRQTFCMGSHGS